MNPTPQEHIDAAIFTLLKSDRGRRVMRDALWFLNESDAIGLDQNGVAALMTLMLAALTDRRLSARDAMRDALELW